MELFMIFMTVGGTIGAVLGAAHVWKDVPPKLAPVAIPDFPEPVGNYCNCVAGRGYLHQHASAVQ